MSDELRKNLGLDDKYINLKRQFKKSKSKVNNIKSLKFKKIKKFLIIGIIIVAFYIINSLFANVFDTNELEYDFDTTNNLTKKEINVALDDNLDPDTDGITTKEELELGTNPFNRDTDKDGVTDDGELKIGTNPIVIDENILEEAYEALDSNKYNIPINYNNFVLRNSSLHSRAYFSIIDEKLPTGKIKTTIRNFKGELEGEAYLKQDDGLHKKIKKVKINGDAQLITEDDESVTTFYIFNKRLIIENTFLRSLVKFFFPEKGMISAFDNLKSDYSPMTLMYDNRVNVTSMNYAKELIKNIGDDRFNLLHINTSYKDVLSDKVRLGEVVPASIITSDNKSEYIILITGEYENGEFMVIDAETEKEVGMLSLDKISKPLTDGDNLVQMQSLSFTLGTLSSENGDRLIFL